MKILPFLFLFVLIPGLISLSAQTALPDTASRESAPAPAAESLGDAALEAELAEQLGAEADTTTAKPQSSPALQGSQARPGGLLNPQISAIGSFVAAGTEKEAVVKPLNLGLSEAEFSFQAYVDPYSRADFYFAFGSETEDPFLGPDSEAVASGEFEAELEEAYLTILSLPFGLQIKAGKFRSNFGRINPVHPHALDYIDYPRMYVNYLGGEGLSDKGAALNWLVPNPLDFYQELSLEVTSGALDGPSFQGGSKHLLYLGHLKNFFDLNDNTTLELGLSGISGPNNAAGDKTAIGTADLTLIWKPLRYNRYRSFAWTTEALFSNRKMPGEEVNSYALYSFMRYQIGRRWFIGARYDYSEFPEHNCRNEKAYSAMLNFYATEFQKIELQFQHGVPAEFDSFNRVLLRAVFVIGAHGAHKY